MWRIAADFIPPSDTISRFRLFHSPQVVQKKRQQHPLYVPEVQEFSSGGPEHNTWSSVADSVTYFRIRMTKKDRIRIRNTAWVET